MTDHRYSPPEASLELGRLKSDQAVSAAEPPKIGGWLLLVALGLIVAPIRGVYAMLTNYVPMFRDGNWARLTTEGEAAYHVLWAPLIIGEIVGNFFHIALGGVTLALFFKKSRSTPKWAIAWYAFGLIFVVIDHVVADFIPAIASSNDPGSTKEAVRAFIAAAVWIPYFMVSKRVKATFVR